MTQTAGKPTVFYVKSLSRKCAYSLPLFRYDKSGKGERQKRLNHLWNAEIMESYLHEEAKELKKAAGRGDLRG